MEQEALTYSRIAPTPSGLIHLGNACNFVLTWFETRRRNGSLRLRIDDLDQQRTRKAYIEDVFFTLDWLGIEWEEGPTGVQEHLYSYSQQDRIPLYLEKIQTLWKTQKAFACDCSRKQIRKLSSDGTYPGTCRTRDLSPDKEGCAIRIFTQKGKPFSWKDGFMGELSQSPDDSMRDFIIQRKDGTPAYQIASLVDDLSYGSTLIVRGQDLIASTAAQLFLAQQLGELSFPQIQWCHHPLLLDTAGGKLSKSEGALAVKTMREQGQSAEVVFRQVGKWLNLPENLGSAKDFLSFIKN